MTIIKTSVGTVNNNVKEAYLEHIKQMFSESKTARAFARVSTFPESTEDQNRQV